MSKQVVYKFSSADGREITVTGVLVREGTISSNAPIVVNDAYRNQATAERPLVSRAGLEQNETTFTQYAKDYGYTLTKTVQGDVSATTLNTSLAAAPTLGVAAAAAGQNNLSWSGSLRMEIWKSRGATSINWQKVATMGSGGTTYADTGNIVGETYQYKVRITDTTKVGTFSNIVSVVATA